MTKRRKKSTASLTRGAAKWRVAGMKANMDQFIFTFNDLLHADERAQLAGCQQHLAYTLSLMDGHA